MTAAVIAAIVAVAATAAAAARWRPATARVVSVAAIAASGVLLGVASTKGGDLGGSGLGVTGFGRGVALLSLAGIAICLLLSDDDSWLGRAWLAHLAVVAVVVAATPVARVCALLLLASILPRLDSERSDRWRRTIVVAALLGFAATAVILPSKPVPDAAVAGALVLTTLGLAGAVPFSAGIRNWLTEGSPLPAVTAVTALVPALVGAASGATSAITLAHAGTTAGLLLGGFGALTVAAGAVGTALAEDWRRLAANGVVSDLGLALVGLATLDLPGLRGAALALVSLVLSRPLMILAAQAAGPGGPIARWISALTAAGLPPTIGFAARLLVVDAAFRLHPVAGLALTAGLAVQAVATLRFLVAPPYDLAPAPPARAGVWGAAAMAAASVLAGLLPGTLLTYVWNLG